MALRRGPFFPMVMITPRNPLRGASAPRALTPSSVADAVAPRGVAASPSAAFEDRLKQLRLSGELSSFKKISAREDIPWPEQEQAEDLLRHLMLDPDGTGKSSVPLDRTNELRYINRALRDECDVLHDELTQRMIKRHSGFGDQYQRAISVPEFYKTGQQQGTRDRANKRASLELANSHQVFINSLVADTLNALQADT